MADKRTGKYELSCGHRVDRMLDPEARVKCPTCQRDSIVVRVLR